MNLSRSIYIYIYHNIYIYIERERESERDIIVYRGGVLLTEIPLPQIARQGITCLVSRRGSARTTRIELSNLSSTRVSDRIIPPSESSLQGPEPCSFPRSARSRPEIVTPLRSAFLGYYMCVRIHYNDSCIIIMGSWVLGCGQMGSKLTGPLQMQ